MVVFRYFISAIFILGAFLLPLDENCAYSKSKNAPKTIKTGNYTLELGKYTGYEADYDHIQKKLVQRKVDLELEKNKITINGISTKFKAKKDKLYVEKRALYEVSDNNKMLMLAGGGILFIHE